ncbi:hypothetical protein E4T56_gene10118 [Termitomyces sp. T112]|nr:hypothetical protein E4T56_gene10118 [Termitomyces sp. T112]
MGHPHALIHLRRHHPYAMRLPQALRPEFPGKVPRVSAISVKAQASGAAGGSMRWIIPDSTEEVESEAEERPGNVIVNEEKVEGEDVSDIEAEDVHETEDYLGSITWISKRKLSS